MAKQTNQPAKPPPFCCDCKHFIPGSETTPADRDFYPRCDAIKMLDLVTGKNFYPVCSEMRNEQAPCAVEGRLWSNAKIVDVGGN